MGMWSWWRIRRMKDPVRGALRVEACAQPDTSPESAWYSALVLGVVTAPGVASRSVEHHCSVPAKRCPRSGQSVPVTVDRSDPRRLVIHWAEVPLRRRLGMSGR